MGLAEARAQRTTRAELVEAMNQARPLAAQLRGALARREALGPAPMLKAAAALRETIGSIRADIRSIAHRAYLDDEAALICLLDQEAKLRETYRRKPSLEQIRKAVARHREEAERQLHADHEAASAAAEKVAEQTRIAIAANAAGELMRACA